MMNYNYNSSSSSSRLNAPRRRPADKDSSELLTRDLIYAAAFILAIFYFEIVFRLARGGTIINRSFAYTSLFSFSAGLILAVLCSFFSEKVNYILTLVMISFLGVYYCVQLVYVNFFQNAFCWEQLASAGDATQFIGNTMTEIWKALPIIILLLAPAVLFGIFGLKKFKVRKMDWPVRIIAALISVLFFIAGVGFVNIHADPLDDKYSYSSDFSMDENINRFGVLTAMRLDTKNILGLYKFEETPVDTIDNPFDNTKTPAGDDTATPTVITSEGGVRYLSIPDPIYTDIVNTYEVNTNSSGGLYLEAEDKTGKPVTVMLKEDASGNLDIAGDNPFDVDTSPNVMNIDFDTLIQNSSGNLQKAHNWFSQRTPTNKNAYTGMFKGKNLIYITVESWAPAAINEKLTPTLWKMKNEGFIFDNYYCSLWGGSTATGEYANITGNFYNSSQCLKKSGSTLEKFTLGNVLKADGYKCYAFHDWTATYYSRDISHPNFGYKYYGTVYQTKGNYPGTKGWNVQFTRAWPLSDYELAVNTTSFIPTDGSPFHIYYMSVSGHPYQTFAGNRQAGRHKMDVMNANLGYTDTNALAFISAQYEVELMVAKLCEDLEAKGILDDTVFVMAPDHFPYQISEDKEANIKTLAALYNLPVADIYSNPELYKAPLIIWSPSMKHEIKVDKVCSAIDILPTVLNLFGEEYDSRLIMGHDILSDCEGFVPLNMSNADANVSSSNNWITDYGVYISKTKTFTPKAGSNFDGTQVQQYINYGCSTLANMRTYSFYILENDYYRKVFK